MGFWERNTIIIGLGSLLGGAFYFSFVVWQSLTLGALAPPDFVAWCGYLVLQFLISVVGIRLATNRSELAELRVLPQGTDERDRLVRSKAEIGQAHVASVLIFICMAAWFAHTSVAILFHSLVAALVVSELVRCAVQMFNYNRAY